MNTITDEKNKQKLRIWTVIKILTPFKKVSPSFSIESLAHPHEHSFPSSFASVGEFYNFIEMCYLKSGKAEFIIEEKVYLVEGGTLVFYKPLHFHKFRSVEGTSLKLYTLSMEISGALPSGIYDTPFSLDSKQEEKFLSAFRAARSFLEGGAEDAVGTLAALELQSLIVDISRIPLPQREYLSTDSARKYKEIIEAMENEVYSNITLDTIAKRVNISRSYLKTLFANYCDISPKEYYRKLRLREAMQLLLDGVSVSEIAERMNFSYPNNFTEFFKKEMGMNPTEYKIFATEFQMRSQKQ